MRWTAKVNGVVRGTATLEIEENKGSYFLYHLDLAGNCIADTWHPTLADAQRQAKSEFAIEAADWIEVPETE